MVVETRMCDVCKQPLEDGPQRLHVESSRLTSNVEAEICSRCERLLLDVLAGRRCFPNESTPVTGKESPANAFAVGWISGYGAAVDRLAREDIPIAPPYVPPAASSEPDPAPAGGLSDPGA